MTVLSFHLVLGVNPKTSEKMGESQCLWKLSHQDARKDTFVLVHILSTSKILYLIIKWMYTANLIPLYRIQMLNFVMGSWDYFVIVLLDMYMCEI